MDGLTKNFNLKSIFHGPFMWIAMAGMALHGLTDPTLLGWASNFLSQMIGGIINLFGSGLPILQNIAVNTMQGNIIPDIANLSDMWNAAISGTSHGVAATAGHLHGAASAAVTNQWQWFGGLTEVARNSMVADAAFFGVPLDQYIADWCTQKGVSFGMSP